MLLKKQPQHIHMITHRTFWSHPLDSLIRYIDGDASVCLLLIRVECLYSYASSGHAPLPCTYIYSIHRLLCQPCVCMSERDARGDRCGYVSTLCYTATNYYWLCCCSASYSQWVSIMASENKKNSSYVRGASIASSVINLWWYQSQGQIWAKKSWSRKSGYRVELAYAWSSFFLVVFFFRSECFWVINVEAHATYTLSDGKNTNNMSNFGTFRYYGNSGPTLWLLEHEFEPHRNRDVQYSVLL